MGNNYGVKHTTRKEREQIMLALESGATMAEFDTTVSEIQKFQWTQLLMSVVAVAGVVYSILAA